MLELEKWVKASAANKRYFKHQLDLWSSSVERKDAYLYDKKEAFANFSHRATLVKEENFEPSGVSRVVNLHTRRIYLKIASCAAILFLMIAGYFLLIKKQDTLDLPRGQESLSYIQIKVPFGVRKKCILPDKTIVWLNAGTVFKYPANFMGHTRDVQLNGEGYFEVAKDKAHPFIVNTAHGSITVTGTVFNVNAYAKSARFVTALLEGHVRVRSNQGQNIDLVPSQKVELKNNQLFMSSIIDPDEYKWKDGLICFDNEHIADVFVHLETAFGAQITIEHLRNPDLHLTGKFRVSDGLEFALKVLSESYGIKYQANADHKGYVITN